MRQLSAFADSPQPNVMDFQKVIDEQGQALFGNKGECQNTGNVSLIPCDMA
ncbi:hypothetical protein [Kushneria konosiri]|uniref:hypothetical protein n=1 Tax=Kushneria konosiri TaxID=698828 RepID=UPI001313ED32|nr:hypothetical protein [Kushneria konosiri]